MTNEEKIKEMEAAKPNRTPEKQAEIDVVAEAIREGIANDLAKREK